MNIKLAPNRIKFFLLITSLLFIHNPMFCQTAKILKPELVFVDGGEFLMGCTGNQGNDCISNEKPAVYVELLDFWIGKYEITNEQFAQFLTYSNKQEQGGENWCLEDRYSLIKRSANGSFQPIKGFEKYPVTNISWYGAEAYTKWLSDITGYNYRLPTEAEWEYASRGGQKSKGFIFSGSNLAEEVAWFSDFAANSKTGWNFKYDKGTHPVGLKLPNELGIYDMSGNASEWCSDFYRNSLKSGICPKGTESSSLRILRGGSWDNKAPECRISARSYAQHVGNYLVNKGFRIVMDVPIQAVVDSFAIEKDFSGTILINKDDRTIYQNSFGQANREQNILNTNETQYLIASISKLFTSTIILQLVDKNLIDLEKTISDYLPSYHGSAGKYVTIHQLLTHTSGIQNCEEIGVSESGISKIYTENLTTDEILNKYCSGSQINKAGSAFNYNNAEYIILGKIIESVTNDTYRNVLKKQILEPLKMTKTDLLISSKDIDHLAYGYKWKEDKSIYLKDSKRYYQNYFSAGAIYSTANDLMTFIQALYNGTLLNDDLLKLLLTTYPETKGYGYGLWVRYPQYNSTVAKVTQRFGQIWGLNTLITHFTDYNITVIVLSNTDKIYVSEFQNIVGEKLLN